MSQENVEIVQHAFEHFRDTGDFLEEAVAPDFVWDMSKFQGWPEQQIYDGLEEAQRFIREWTEPFDDWRIEVESIHDAGDDKVVTILRQHGRSTSSGLPVEMLLAQVYTIRDGKQARMEMYADPADALKAVGLAE